MDLQRYVGIPWADRGRDRDTGLDCWALVLEVYRWELGIQLPSYHEDYQTAADKEAVARLIDDGKSDWHEMQIGREKPFDLVLMREAGVSQHIGIVVQRPLMLHVRPHLDSVIESYSSGRNRNRVVGFFRHESLL